MPRVKRRHDSSTDDNSPVSANRNLASTKNQKGFDSDNTPPRYKSRESQCKSDSDNSPPRHKNTRCKKEENDSDNSPPRKRPSAAYSDSDNSPPRAKDKSSLAQKTLDGKMAGLQSASALKSEMNILRGEEKKRLAALSSEVSGKGAKTMVRGRLKEKEEEEEKRKAQAEISEEVKEKYSRWSKG